MARVTECPNMTLAVHHTHKPAMAVVSVYFPTNNLDASERLKPAI